MNIALWILIFGAGALLLYTLGDSVDTSNWPVAPNAAIAALAKAIAIAEGSPTSWNNPGDLTLGDAGGFPLQLNADNTPIVNSAGVVRFASLTDGVTALYNKLLRIQNGSSKVYSQSLSLLDFANIYTGGDNAPGWAQTVAENLGLDPATSTLGDALGTGA